MPSRARMPHATCLTIAGAEHEILMERDIYRDQLWRAFDRFMQEKRRARESAALADQDVYCADAGWR